MPKIDIEILVNSCYMAQLNIENLANQNLESLQTLTNYQKRRKPGRTSKN